MKEKRYGELFGKLDTGADVYELVLKNGNIEASIITYGAAIRKLVVFGTDVVGGYDTLEDYVSDDSHQGGVIGRVANRIKQASFVLDGVRYHLPRNDGENCLHGGEGFDRRIWRLVEFSDESLTLEYESKDGDEGFPAALDVRVTYTLTESALRIDYTAEAEGRTPVALTNHAYFNLDGFGGDILGHEAEIFADYYTAVDENLIPTGERPAVAGTAFDFCTAHKIGERLSDDFDGYDHNYILAKRERRDFDGKALAFAARVSGRGITMKVYTDQPGIQFYTGNFLGGNPSFKGGIARQKHGAFCLETQTEPNCINHGEAIYYPEKLYTHTTVYEFEEKIQ